MSLLDVVAASRRKVVGERSLLRDAATTDALAVRHFECCGTLENRAADIAWRAPGATVRFLVRLRSILRDVLWTNHGCGRIVDLLTELRHEGRVEVARVSEAGSWIRS